MDRRAFLGLFAKTSAAAGAAATGLISIPEAKPKIELLEEKQIITDIKDDEIIFDSVIDYKIYRDYQYMQMNIGSISKRNSPGPLASIEENIKATVYIENHTRFLFGESFYASFLLPELMGKRYYVKALSVIHSFHSFDTMEIEGVLAPS